MTTTPTQEPARAGEQMTENTKAVECRGAEIAQRLINAAGQFVVICREGPITDEMQEYLADVFQSILDDNAAQPAVPEGVDIVRKALELATVICDTVPARLHANGDEGWQYRLGVLVNKQPDGTHGYRLIQDALAALSAPQPAAQESAQPAGEQERRENSKHWPLLDRVEFALRDASFDLDEAFAIAHHVSLTYPPQPESAQGERGAVAWSVLQIGNTGAAYDPPNTHRAFTYDRQPGNIEASKLGRAALAAANASAGDSIDHGLALLKTLQDEGFGVFQVGPTTPTGDQNARAVGEVMHATQIGSHGDYSVFRWTCPGGLHGFLQRHPVGTKLYTHAPAPVAQVGDGRVTELIEASKAADAELAAEGFCATHPCRERLRAAIEALARTQENG